MKNLKEIRTSLNEDLVNEFTAFCHKTGRTKRSAMESALRNYMDQMNQIMNGKEIQNGKKKNEASKS